MRKRDASMTNTTSIISIDDSCRPDQQCLHQFGPCEAGFVAIGLLAVVLCFLIGRWA
jgi:hypothetical protein